DHPGALPPSTILEYGYAIAPDTDSTHAANCSSARYPLQVLGVVGEGSLFSIRLVAKPQVASHSGVVARQTAKPFGCHVGNDEDKILDQGGSNEDILNTMSTLLKELHDINSVESLEKTQKAKIRWPIESDENFKYFHVKNEFFSHFSNPFLKSDSFRICLVDQYTNRLSSDKKEDLERNVTLNEIKNKDIMVVVSDFFSSGEFSSGWNSSLIALIPKIHDAKVVTDFRPISLIGSLYKIITKILANRLSLVISDLISDVQSAFVTNRQFLNGSFILNELLSWCKQKKLKAMFFKVDFEKAFDSIRWDYLIDVLRMFGFGNKWRGWNGCLKSARGSVLVNGIRP
ncbi:RNA-directed DNA polymerase, eukaryota, partial [Tanacetum coccineum]